MKKTLLFLILVFLFTACSSEDEWNPANETEGDVKELKLSVSGDISIDGVEYEFDILDGNGGYTLDVDEEFAKVTITGTKVKVDLLTSAVNIIITDQKGKNAMVSIFTTAESLVPKNYGLFMRADSIYTMKDIDFGAGEYTLQKIKGTSAEAVITENDHVKVTALKPGKTYYKIKDKRGSVASFEIIITDNYDYTGNNLVINTTHDQVINVIFKSGTGWKIMGDPSSPLTERIVLHARGNVDGYDTLQIDTSDDDNKGTVMILLMDDAGNYATVTVHVR